MNSQILSRRTVLVVAVARIAFVADAVRAEPPGPRVLGSFESAEEVSAFFGEGDHVQVSYAVESATHGSGSARLSFPPYDPRGRNWPSVSLRLGGTPAALTDWSAYAQVKLDVTNPAAEQRELGISFHDAAGKRAAYSYWNVPPNGKSVISFDIARLATQLDCTQMSHVTFWQRLHLRKPKDRTVFFVDSLRLVPYSPNQMIGVTIKEPHFRNAVYSSQKVDRVKATVCLSQIAEAGGTQAEAALILPDGTAAGRRPLEMPADEQTVEFPLPTVASGQELLLRIVASRADGNEVARSETAITVHPPVKDEVTFDAQNRLLLNGRPFFPLGIYNVPTDDFGLLADMGFNCVGPYIGARPENVAEAQKHGLRIINSVGERALRDRETLRAAAESGTVLAHYLYDEPAPDRVPELTALCRRAAEVDPYHPTTGCNNLHHFDYATVADVMMVDSYPLPGPLDEIVERMTAAMKARNGRGPVWYVPQAHARLGYADAGRTLEKTREPTLDELRAATWLGIVLGAQGVVYYSHRIQSFRIRYAFPILWRELGFTVKELAALQDSLLWPRAPVESSVEHVYAAAFVADGKTLVAVVNAALEPVEATLRAPVRTASLAVLGEARSVTVTDGQFRDTFAPQSAHLYVSWPATPPVEWQAAREEIEQLRAAHDAEMKGNIARCYTGATVEASWTFPTDTRARPWEWMIDGYRGTQWPLGARGRLGRTFQYPRAMNQADRWIEIRFAKRERLDRAVVITADVNYQLAVPVGDTLRTFEPVSEEQTTEYGPGDPVTIRMFALDGVTADRVRLILPERPKGERYFEVEVYRAGRQARRVEPLRRLRYAVQNWHRSDESLLWRTSRTP